MISQDGDTGLTLYDGHKFTHIVEIKQSTTGKPGETLMKHGADVDHMVSYEVGISESNAHLV